MNIGIRISVIKKDTTSKNKVYISSPSVRFPIYYIILLFKYGIYIVFCTIIILMSSVSLSNCINMKKEIHNENNLQTTNASGTQSAACVFDYFDTGFRRNHSLRLHQSQGSCRQNV